MIATAQPIPSENSNHLAPVIGDEDYTISVGTNSDFLLSSSEVSNSLHPRISGNFDCLSLSTVLTLSATALHSEGSSMVGQIISHYKVIQDRLKAIVLRHVVEMVFGVPLVGS